MKNLIVFLVFLCALWAAYFYGAPFLREYLEEKDAGAENAEARQPSRTAKAREENAVAATPKGTPPEVPAAATPAKAASSRPASEIDRLVDEFYPVPDFPPLVELVNDWNDIPPRAFPRELNTRVPIDFELRVGGTIAGKRTLEAGSKVTATAFEGGQLTVKPAGAETLVALVGLDDTDFRESIAQGYEIFKQRRTERIMALRAEERKRLERAEADEATALMGWTDGSAAVFAPMKESLARGEAKDRILEDAKRFRWLGRETVHGVEYECGVVVTEVETIFGIFASELKALIRNGKVEKWVDPVSGEEL